LKIGLLIYTYRTESRIPSWPYWCSQHPVPVSREKFAVEGEVLAG